MARLRNQGGDDIDVRDPGSSGEGNFQQPSQDDPGLPDNPYGDRSDPVIGAPHDPNAPQLDLDAQSQEKPNERLSGGGAQATLRRPSVPTPMAGSSFQAGLQPFTPMGDSSQGSLLSPGGGGPGLRGMSSGLKGGGLGVPLNPINTADNPDLSGLIAQLLKMRG